MVRIRARDPVGQGKASCLRRYRTANALANDIFLEEAGTFSYGRIQTRQLSAMPGDSGTSSRCGLSQGGEPIGQIEKEITREVSNDEVGQRLMTIPGIGVIMASVLASEMGDGKQYRCGRDFAAAIGLVPRQHSTGGRNNLLGTSRRGDKNIRSADGRMVRRAIVGGIARRPHALLRRSAACAPSATFNISGSSVRFQWADRSLDTSTACLPWAMLRRRHRENETLPTHVHGQAIGGPIRVTASRD